MTYRMTTKEDINVKYTKNPFNGTTQEAVVYVIRDNKSNDYIVSDTPQTLLGYHLGKRFQRVYSGPYSKWNGEHE